MSRFVVWKSKGILLNFYIFAGEDSVLSVIERLVCQDVSQLVVTEGEEAGGVEGVVTISDILHYLVTVHRQSTAPPHHQR